MARQRDPRRDEAFEIWKKSGGETKLKDIAAQLGVSDTQIRKWKSQDQWEQKLKGNVTNEKRNVTKKERAKESVTQKVIEEIAENDELTEKQRLFCLYYVKTFNATQAAIKAGYAPDSAHVRGSELVRNRKVADYIRKVKQDMTGDIFVDAMDVLQKWVKIAFADVTDYLTFGQKEVEVMGAFGPIKDEDGNVITRMVNYVEFNESNMVDGTLITEVKQGRDGVSIKLADKMKALEKLSLYFDLFPDQFKRQIEEEKLKLEQRKVIKEDTEEEYEDDGFLDALDGKEVDWNEEA